MPWQTSSRGFDLGELARAVARGDIRMVDELILRGVDPNQPDIKGKTPLIYAVESGRYELVKRILHTTADLDLAGSDGLTPLMISIGLGREDLVSLLVQYGANTNVISTDKIQKKTVSALSIAIDRREYTIARRLIMAGADGLLLATSAENNPLDLPLCQIPLDREIWRNLAMMSSHANSPDWDTDDWSLHRVVRDGDWFEARALLENNADPNKGDNRKVTPLLVAAWHGYSDIVKLLIKYGADPSSSDINGVSALSYAVVGNNPVIASYLLETQIVLGQLSADNIPLETSPYYWAVISGSPAMVKLLNDSDWPLPDKGKDNMTLLMVSSWLSDVFSVRLLTPLVDDGGALDSQGYSALEWSIAAFAMDRKIGRETNRSHLGDKNYSVARILVRRGRDANDFRSIITSDVDAQIIESWQPEADPQTGKQWRDVLPLSVPHVPGRGDLTLYRILRDEEQS